VSKPIIKIRGTCRNTRAGICSVWRVFSIKVDVFFPPKNPDIELEFNKFGGKWFLTPAR
jgi:hypothetical protein